MNMQIDLGRGPAAPKREPGRERIGVAFVGVGGAVATTAIAGIEMIKACLSPSSAFLVSPTTAISCSAVGT